jgi:acetoacetate decarboxylase
MRLGDELHDSYSAPHISPLYPNGPYEYTDSTVLAVFYSVSDDLARGLLPEPLEVAGEPNMSLWFFEYPETNGLGAYNEVVVGVNAVHDGEHLMYVAYEGLDSEIPICAGREIHGTGKKYGTVTLEQAGNLQTATYERNGIGVISASVCRDKYVDDHPMTHDSARNAYWKRIPSAAKDAPPAVDRITVSVSRDIDVDWALSGDAEVSFERSAADPLYRLAPISDVTGYVMNLSFVLDNVEEPILHTFDEYSPPE